MAAASVALALDLVSFVLAAALGVLLARADRALPARGYRVLAVAFPVLGLGYLAVGTSAFRLLQGADLVDALRVAGGLVGASLVFLGYLARRVGLRLRILTGLAASFGIAGVLYLALYYAIPPFASLPEPLTYLPWVRAAEAGLLAGASLLVALEVHGREVSEYKVPAAFLLLAIEKYTVALLVLVGSESVLLVAYAWRLAGLALLLHVAWPFRRWPTAPA